MTTAKRWLDLCLGGGFLAGVPLIALVGTLLIGSLFPEPISDTIMASAFVIAPITYALALLSRCRRTSSQMSTIMIEVIASLMIGSILCVVLFALMWVIAVDN